MEPDGKAKVCECGNDTFYHTRGHKKRNEQMVEGMLQWEAKQYYINKCTKCGCREDAIIQDWHKVWTMKQPFHVS